MESNLPIPNRALAIAAHPDDVEFGCGGTLAKWAANGCEIFHLVCTDGSKGTWDPAHDPAELVVTRRSEQRAASMALGGKGEVIFLGWPDGELESGLRQRFEVAALLEHRSQLRSTMGIAEANAVEDGEHPEVLEFKRRVIDRLAENGRKGG